MSTFYSEYQGGNNAPIAGVTQLNGLTGALSLVAGSGITITPSGSNITIASTGGSAAGSNGQVQFNNSGSFGASANLFWDNTNNALSVGTGGAITTSNPTIYVSDTVTSNPHGFVNENVQSGSAIASGVMAFKKARGTFGSKTAVQSGDILGTVSVFGYDGTAYSAAADAAIFLQADQTFTSSAHGTKMVFAVTPDSTTTRTNTFTINSTGSLTLSNTAGSTNGTQIISFAESANLNGTLIKSNKSRGAPGAPTIVQQFDQLLNLSASGYDGTAFSVSDATILFQASDPSWSTTSHGTAIVFQTTPTASVTRRTVAQFNADASLQLAANGTDSVLLYATAGGTASFNLPNTQGTSGQVLTTDGATPANLTWTTVSSGGGTWTSANWNSSDSVAFNTYPGTQSSIYGDSTIKNQYLIGTSDIPLSVTTRNSSILNIFTGDVLEPTSNHKTGDINIQPGTNAGTGKGGDLVLFGSIANTGAAGGIYLAVGPGTPDGKIFFQPKTSGAQAAINDIWTATTTTGGGTWQTPAVTSTKITKTFTNFSTAANTNSITLFSLPAATVIEQILIVPSASFTGGTITAYTVSVGVSGNNAKYASAFDVFQAPGSTVAQLSTSPDFEDLASPVNITVTATSTGDTLDHATTGSVDIYVITRKMF